MMSKHPDYDFAGYATRNDLRCTDGVTIRHGAFRDNDGKRVPLVWSHSHQDPSNVIGHAILEQADDGVYAYGYFNNSEKAQNAKELVAHKDVQSLSIGANRIKRTPSNDVIHGNIYELSLVVAGANPGAVITEVLQHSDEEGETVILENTDLIHSAKDVLVGEERISLFDRIAHADTDEEATDIMDEALATLNEDQQEAVSILIDQAAAAQTEAALEEVENNIDDIVSERLKEIVESLDEEGEDEVEIEQSDNFGGNMHYNAFENTVQEEVANEQIRHSLTDAMEQAQRTGRKLSQVLSEVEGGDVLQHSISNVEKLFPEHTLTGGVQVRYSTNTATEHILGAVTKVPTSFVKSIETDLSDLTDEQLRAKGYIKGNEKKDQILSFFSRKTDPKTIYKKQSIDRDDVIDIAQQLNVAAFFQQEMRIKLNDEIAQAILVGDGRAKGAEGKIDEDKIRPIKSDDDYFTIKKDYNANMLLDIFETVAKAKTEMYGSGMPSLYINPLFLTQLRFLRNKNEQWVFGGQQPATKEYLASLFGVKEIVETNFLKNDEIIMVNLADYQVGTNRGGEVNTFDFFDIDYNKQKYLIETRLSGALVKGKSAVYFKAAAGGSAIQPGA